MKRIIRGVLAALLAVFCAAATTIGSYAANVVPLGKWNAIFYRFDDGDFGVLGDKTGFAVNAFDTGEIRLFSTDVVTQSYGVYPLAVLSSTTVKSLDLVSVTLRADAGFSFDSGGEYPSFAAFTWSDGALVSEPANYADIAGVSIMPLLPAGARALSVILTGTQGTTVNSATVILRSAGADRSWSISLDADLASDVTVRISRDSWFGQGYLINVGGTQLAVEGATKEPDLNPLVGTGDGFLYVSCSGGLKGASNLVICAVGGTSANAFSGSVATDTDANGVLVPLPTQQTTDPGAVTGGDQSEGNPDSGDDGLVVAIVLLVASACIAAIVFVKRKK